jgi:tungstate transport system ATP-binding protein
MPRRGVSAASVNILRDETSDSNPDLPIEFFNVEVIAGGIKVLNRVSLRITTGPPTFLIGPNGSGKTTFLRAAIGLISPSSGHVTWGGRKVSPPTRRAIVLQRPVMLRRSVSGNIGYALEETAVPHSAYESRINELLALVGLAGLETRPARRLSGGEQQRLALARALARDPAVLFLDEPTANLDPAATKSIEEIVRGVSARGVKVVMATHDLGEARRLAGDIVLLHRGDVIESGPADAFFAAPATSSGKRFLAGELLT